MESAASTNATEKSVAAMNGQKKEDDAFQRCLSASTLQDVMMCREALLKREMELRLAEAAATAAGVAISRVASSNGTTASNPPESFDEAADAVAVRVLLEEISSKLSRRSLKFPADPDELSMEEILAIHVGAMDDDLDQRRRSLDTKLSAAETVTTADETLSVLSSISCSPFVESARLKADEIIEERDSQKDATDSEEANMHIEKTGADGIADANLQAGEESDEPADGSALRSEVAALDKVIEESDRRADVVEDRKILKLGIATKVPDGERNSNAKDEEDDVVSSMPSETTHTATAKHKGLKRSLSSPPVRPNIIPEDETLELDQFLSRRESHRQGGADDVSSVGSLSATRVGSVLSATSTFVEMTPLEETPADKEDLLELLRHELADAEELTMKKIARAWGIEDEEEFFLRFKVTPSQSVLEEKQLVDAAVEATQKMEAAMAWLQDLRKAALEDGDVETYAASLLPQKSEIRMPASDRLEPKVLPSPVRMVSSCPRQDSIGGSAHDHDDDTAWRTYWSEEHQREYYQDPKSGEVSWIAPRSVSSKSKFTWDNEDSSSTQSSITPSVLSRGDSSHRSFALSQHSLMQAAMCIHDEAEQQRKAKAKALYNVAKNLEKEKEKLTDRKPRDDATETDEDDGETVVVSDFTRPRTASSVQEIPDEDAEDLEDDCSIDDISVKVQRYRKKLRRRRPQQPIRDLPVVVMSAVLASVLHVVFKDGMVMDVASLTDESLQAVEEDNATGVDDGDVFEELGSDDGDEHEPDTETRSEQAGGDGGSDEHDLDANDVFEEVGGDEHDLEADDEFEEVRSDEHELDPYETKDSFDEAFADTQEIADGMIGNDGEPQAIDFDPSMDTAQKGGEDDADEQTLAFIDKLRPKDEETKASSPLWTDEVSFEAPTKEDTVDLESFSFGGNDLLGIARENATFVNVIPSEEEEKSNVKWLGPAGYNMTLSEFEA